MSQHQKSLSRFTIVLFICLFATVSAIVPAGVDSAMFAGNPDLFRIVLSGENDVGALVAMDLDITTVRPGQYAEAYLVDRERLELLARGFTVYPMVDNSREYLETLGQQGYIPQPGREWTSYPTFSEMETWLQDMETSYPGLCDLFSIGQSTNGRDLWVMKISDNAGTEEAEPEFKYIGAMHGNETLCVPLLLNLIEHLLANYGSDPAITAMVDNREIFIMPLMNPDGYVSGSRYNAQGRDLNRDFPDFIEDPVNEPDGRGTETQLVMLWQLEQTFVLSANFHTGATVVNYPWDSTWDYCPDDTVFYHMALGYASRNEPMYSSSYFEDGVTRGVEWYMTHGSMQDWNYYWYADYDVIIELSDPSSPPASQIDDYWDDNRESMLYHIDLAGKGLTGTVTDAITGGPVAAEITVSGIDMPTPVHCDPDHGNYVRPLYTGEYTVTYSAEGYEPQTLDNVPVIWEEATVRDIALVPLDVTMVATGPGHASTNPPLVRMYSAQAPGEPLSQWLAYGTPAWGVNLAAGDLDGSGRAELVTGAGPGAVFGPHVRAFSTAGSPVSAVNFLAYGTNKFGVNVTCGDIDGDGMDEIVTGAGPGAVFGPHVRGWNSDGGSVSPVSGVSYFAYGTLKYGVNVSCGDIDGDGTDEIITGAGPGAVFGPHVRGWNVDGGAAASIPGVSYFAYGTLKYGVNVTCGDIDGDGMDEIVTGSGPGQIFGAHVRGWDVDGGAAAAIPGVNFFAYPGALYGVNISCGDLDADGFDEILTMPGPDPDQPARLRVWNVDGGSASAGAMDFDAFEDLGLGHGGNVAGGSF